MVSELKLINITNNNLDKIIEFKYTYKKDDPF